MTQEFELLRFSYETNLFRTIESLIGSVSPEDYVVKNLMDIRKQELLGDAVRITADLLPDIHQIYRTCLDLIGGELYGDLFIRQSPEYNASVYAQDNKFDVLVHSALIKDFDTDELRFVFGHELGHVVFGHSWFPMHDIMANFDRISPETRELLLRWARSSEISADRIGLLCCGKLSPAVTALFKTSSGLPGIDVDRVLRSFRKQYEDLENHIRSVSHEYSWIRTHPMIPIRFKALELAALDIVALRQQSKGFSWKGFRSIDHQIAITLETLDRISLPPQVVPNYLSYT